MGALGKEDDVNVMVNDETLSLAMVDIRTIAKSVGFSAAELNIDMSPQAQLCAMATVMDFVGSRGTRTNVDMDDADDLLVDWGTPSTCLNLAKKWEETWEVETDEPVEIFWSHSGAIDAESAADDEESVGSPDFVRRRSLGAPEYTLEADDVVEKPELVPASLKPALWTVEPLPYRL